MNGIDFKKALANLTAAQRETYEERAGIMEYHGKLTRAEAERKALAIVLNEGKEDG